MDLKSFLKIKIKFMTESDKRKNNDSLASFKFDFTDEQKEARKVCHNNVVTVLTGRAGTSKSTIAASIAVECIKSKSRKHTFSYQPEHQLDYSNVKKIILTRPAVPHGKDLGFLPGDIEGKLSPYISPILTVMDELVGGEKPFTEELIEKGMIEIIPLQFMRGVTFKNCIVIADEGQNADLNDFKLLSSRLGCNSKLIVTSDWRQVDLADRNKSADQWFGKILHLKGVGTFELTENFRHPLSVSIMDVLLETSTKKKYLYRGQLKGFPKEIVNKMLDYQAEQGNKRDVSVFERSKCRTKLNGGFDWRETTEGVNFWDKVISGKDFDLFFEKYPKKTNNYEKI